MAFVDAALHLIDAYGYVALFVLMALETAMILHFVPSEAMVTVAALRLAHSWAGVAAVVAVATAGSVVGSLLLYAVARYGGRPFLARRGRVFGLTPERLARSERLFERPAGESLVFFLRLVPVLRAVVSVPAGMARMPVAKFTLFSTLGNGLFNAILASLAFAGKADAAQRFALEAWPFALIVALVAIGAAAYAFARRLRRREEDRHDHIVMEVWTGAAFAITALGVVLLAGALIAPIPFTRFAGAISDDLAAWLASRELAPVIVALVLALELVAIGLGALAVRRWVRTLVARVGGR